MCRQLLETSPAKISGLDKALEITEQFDIQSTFNLKSCYYHLKIFEPHHKFLRAKFNYTNKEGKKKYFIYM